MEHLTFTVTDKEQGKRLDQALSFFLPEQSRSYLSKLLEEGKVLLNDSSAKKSAKLKAADVITLELPDPEPLDVVPQDIPLDILYEDEDLLVVNKPKGMVVHPSPGHSDGTLVNAVLFHCKNNLSGINGSLRPGIVHRIDMDTSGSLIVCKNDAAHQGIAEQLAVHSMDRRYHCIFHGLLNEDEITIHKPLARDPKDRLKIAVRPEGKDAITHITVLERFPAVNGHEAYTYAECRLMTGRTHQIRVHLSSIHHPILGDGLYCPDSLLKKEGKLGKLTTGQCLHAKYLSFVHPVTKETVTIDTKLPEYFQQILKVLRTA